MTILDLIASPDPANWDLALTIANTKELSQIVATLEAQAAQHRKEHDAAVAHALDCRKKIMLESDKHDVERAWAKAVNATAAELAVNEKLQAVLAVANKNQLKLDL